MIRFFLFAFILMAVGCKERGRDTVSRQKMVDVTWDLLKVDELMLTRAASDTTYKVTAHRQTLYDSVFSKHKIKETDYRKTLAVYEARPSEDLRIMIDSLQATGERERKIADSLKKPNYPTGASQIPRMFQVRDSIKKAHLQSN